MGIILGGWPKLSAPRKRHGQGESGEPGEKIRVSRVSPEAMGRGGEGIGFVDCQAKVVFLKCNLRDAGMA